MPSNLLLDTQSAVGYNSSLKKATSEMKFRVNSSVNLETKSVGVGLMNGGSSKINKPTPQAFGQATERQAPRGNYHLNWNSSDDTPKVKWDKSRWVKGNIDFSWTGISHCASKFLFDSGSECHDKSLHSALELRFWHPKAMQCFTMDKETKNSRKYYVNTKLLLISLSASLYFRAS